MAANTYPSALVPNIIGVARETLSQTMNYLGNTNHDFSGASARPGSVVNIGIPAPLTTGSVTPANIAPAPSAITTTSTSLTMGSAVKASFALSGLDNQNYDLSSVNEQQIREAVRAVSYAVNAQLHAKYVDIYQYAGTAGTGFFASNADGLPTVERILLDAKVNMPEGGYDYIMPTKDLEAAKKIDQLQNANTFGNADLIQRGILGNALGFNFYADQQVPIHTTGTITTGAIAKTSTAQAAGLTSIVCTTAASTGAVALKEGDVVNLGTSGENYVFQADVTEASAATDFTITIDRGLLTALTGDEALTVLTGTSLQGIAGDLSGMSVVLRTPEVMAGGFSAQGQHFPIVDSVSGATYLLSVYGQYQQVAFEISVIPGVAVTDPRRLVRVQTYAS